MGLHVLQGAPWAPVDFARRHHQGASVKWLLPQGSGLGPLVTRSPGHTVSFGLTLPEAWEAPPPGSWLHLSGAAVPLRHSPPWRKLWCLNKFASVCCYYSSMFAYYTTQESEHLPLWDLCQQGGTALPLSLSLSRRPCSGQKHQAFTQQIFVWTYYVPGTAWSNLTLHSSLPFSLHPFLPPFPSLHPFIHSFLHPYTYRPTLHRRSEL